MITSQFVDELIQAKVSSCLVHVKGELIYHYEHEPNASQKLMPINSCTKSVVSALYCIGLDRGLVPGPKERIAPYFPELLTSAYADKRELTVEHLLTLTAGFTWQEFGGDNHFPRMTRSDHWIDFVLQQPLANAPGEKWQYNSGVSQLLASLIERASGSSLAQLAEQYLWGPLHINDYSWKVSPQGENTGGYGMELSADDMLKFGLLFLNEGEFEGKQIISSELCRQATTPYIAVEAPERGYYGWHWWCEKDEHMPYYYARGYGGQFIVVVPNAELVVVFTRNQKHKRNSPLNIFRQQLHPQLVSQVQA